MRPASASLNPDWQSSEPYYDDFYCIWDTYRTSSPLLTLISPYRQRDIIRSLVDIYRHTGYMPDARSGNDNGRTQGGSNANVVVADAYVKGLKGIDYETAFAALRSTATMTSPSPRSLAALGRQKKLLFTPAGPTTSNTFGTRT
jgi:putative alpha-1,2-mannosidase